MSSNSNIDNLTSRVEYLEDNRRFIQNALEMALSLGDFQEEINNNFTPYKIFEETEKRVSRLIQFEACALYIIDQSNADLLLSVCKPFEFKQFIEHEIEFMIDKGFIAWAIRERKGVSILSKDQKRQILLHVIATNSQIRGIFVGVFPADINVTQDASLELLSIILRNTANALESVEHNERILAEKALRESKERIERILFSLPTGIVIIDSETHEILDVNQKAISMIGAPKAKIIGSKCHKFICSAEENQCPITDLCQTLDNSERVLITANFDKVPIHKSVIPVTLDGQKCLIESFVDISEHKRSEEERIQKEKLQGVLEMAGAICHELNQPLQTVYGYSDLLLMNMSEDNPNYSEMNIIKGQVERMGIITKKLMGITKYETKDYLKGKIIDIDKASKSI